MGARGEKAAARFLTRAGYKILYRQFRAKRGGEVDLVCRHSDTLVFVEVKTRSDTKHGRPYEAVDAEKRRLIIQGADAWLRMLDYPDILYRFDIVEIIADPDGQMQCEIVADAFTSVREFER